MSEIRDRLDRPLASLRLSVTDRCNLRCRYCMPEDEYVWLPRASILTFEELERVVRVFAGLGVRKVRLTGGEPLLRQDLPALVRLIARIPEIEDLALTTNGLLLAKQAPALRAAGLRRVTVSLDTLRPERMLAFATRARSCGSSSTWTWVGRRTGRWTRWYRSATCSPRWHNATARSLRYPATAAPPPSGSVSRTARRSGSSLRSPRRSAAPATAAASPRTARGFCVCTRRAGSICASVCAAARATRSWRRSSGRRGRAAPIAGPRSGSASRIAARSIGSTRCAPIRTGRCTPGAGDLTP